MAQGNLWGKKITVTLFTVTLRGQYRIKLEITVTLCKARPGAAHGAESRPGGPGPGRKINNSSGGGRALPKPNLLGWAPSGRAELVGARLSERKLVGAGRAPKCVLGRPNVGWKRCWDAQRLARERNLSRGCRNAAGIRSRSKHGAASQIQLFVALEARWWLKLTCALSQEEDGDSWSSSSAPELDDDVAHRCSRYSTLIERRCVTVVSMLLLQVTWRCKSNRNGRRCAMSST